MKAIETVNAPKAIGPYSQAILAGDFLWISGQLPIDPKTNEFAGTDCRSQTIQVLKNIEAILFEAGLTFKNVVRADVFLQDMNDFSTLNEIYATFFSSPPYPARQTIQVAKLPKNAVVEISCVALVKR